MICNISKSVKLFLISNWIVFYFITVTNKVARKCVVKHLVQILALYMIVHFFVYQTKTSIDVYERLGFNRRALLKSLPLYWWYFKSQGMQDLLILMHYNHHHYNAHFCQYHHCLYLNYFWSEILRGTLKNEILLTLTLFCLCEPYWLITWSKILSL